KTSYSSVIKPHQDRVFNAVSNYKESQNPLALRDISKESVTTSLLSRNPQVNGREIAKHIQNLFVERGDGKGYLATKTTEELATFRSGLVKIIANDIASRDALAPHLELVNQVGQSRIAQEAARSAPRNESSHSHRSAAAAARVTVDHRTPVVASSSKRTLSKDEMVGKRLRWAQHEARKNGKEFSESDLQKLTVHAKVQESDSEFKKIVRNVLQIAAHEEK
ncbi:MAG: hypothetical protein KDK64_08475, partial [Chlamydiia bacterium]|nr:hypothetical protein [Chlamydiia bacterium]